MRVGKTGDRPGSICMHASIIARMPRIRGKSYRPCR